MKSNAQGFTLVEIVVVMLIVAVLFSCFIMFFLIGFRLWDGGYARIELQQELRVALELISNDLRQSSQTQISGVNANGAPYSSISFYICNGVSGGNISWGSNLIHYGIINSNELQRIEGAMSTVIAHNIRSLQFRRQPSAPDTVEVSLQLGKSLMQSDLNDNLTFKVKMRN